MPRTAPSPSLVSTLRQQAAQALVSLQKEIAQRETELALLKAEAARWQAIVQQSPRAPSRTQNHAANGPRLQWDTVLQALPEVFTVREVAQQTAKPMGQVYVGIRRWLKKKTVKKIAEGYQKVTAGHSAVPAKSKDKRKS